MSLIYYSALFILFICIPFRVLSDEHKTESFSVSPQETKFVRPTQRTTIVQKTPSLNYPNHQTHYSNPLQHSLSKNITKTFNNHHRETSKRFTNNNYSNHRIEENVTVKQGITSKENKKEKFVINIDDDDDDYKPSHHLANKQKNIKAVLTNLLRKSESNENFAAVLPILKVISPAQRVALASLVTNQITNGEKNNGLKLAQVKSMFGNNSNATSDLMLPIILDIANLFRALKDYNKKKAERLPHPELLRRSFGDHDSAGRDIIFSDITQVFSKTPARSLRRMDVIEEDEENESDIGVINNSTKINQIVETDAKLGEKRNSVGNDVNLPNATLTDAGNITSEDLPVAEELRYINKFRNGNIQMPRPLMVRRPIQSGHNLPPNHPNRRMSSTEQRRRQAIIAEQQRLASAETAKPMKCNFFTDTLCLDVSDYPMHAITASIRKNLNVMNALHTDFPEISADSALDGISKKQEDKYTPEHYLNNINRREDGETRPGDASGFMCPSIVKYARPQKARATSGHWKYIVNTGEHTQTLRLEKCLKPKESCTFLTDNFKSKCVQVYNYHRLLTWDQQNGLHMDIFKVPTCCSCHIEGYSFAFPPHSGKPLEVTSENFPGEELIHESEKNRYAYASTPVRQTVSKETILNAFRNGNSEDYSSLSTLQHYNFPKNDPTFDIQRQTAPHQFPSLNTNYYEDVYQTQDTNIHTRNVKKPPRDSGSDTELPSFLEPPSKPGVSHPKMKPAGNVYVKRGHVGNQANILKRPIRKPIRKKISQVIVDDQEIGASDNYETQNNINPETIPGNSHTKIPTIIHSSTEVATLPGNNSHTQLSSTTERHFTKVIPPERGNGILKDISLNRRVNYNYHPIIDFFGESDNDKSDHVASDRIDSVTEFNSQEESDWRPMTGPLLPLKSPPLKMPSNNG